MSASVGYVGKAVNEQREVVGAQADARTEAMWGPIDGEVVDYDAATQTATVRPLYKPMHNGKPVDMPELQKVPINFPRSGQGAITHPVPAGTRVRLTPMMRSSELYHTEDNGEPSDTRSFALSDMEASLTGGDPLTSPLQNVDPDNTHIRANAEGTFGLRISPDGKFMHEGAEGDIYALVHEAVGLCEEGFTLLATEPALVHTAEYATIASSLGVIAGKLGAMQL